MTPEVASAVAAVATFFVVAAGSVAALIQLRHMRTSNQMSAILEYERLLLSEDFHRLRSELVTHLDEWLQDEAAMARMQSGAGYEYRVVTGVANIFENLGSMVRFGMLDPDVACGLWAHLVTVAWDRLAPLTMRVRVSLGTDGIWENFEYFAWLSKRYREQHPEGTYPAGVPRLLPPASAEKV